MNSREERAEKFPKRSWWTVLLTARSIRIQKVAMIRFAQSFRRGARRAFQGNKRGYSHVENQVPRSMRMSSLRNQAIRRTMLSLLGTRPVAELIGLLSDLELFDEEDEDGRT